jgi:hypothetical protein
MVQLQRGRPNPGPAELRVLKRLGKQTHPRAIKPDRLDPVRSFRAEYVKRATEWISATIPDQAIKPVAPLRKSTGMLAT